MIRRMVKKVGGKISIGPPLYGHQTQHEYLSSSSSKLMTPPTF